MENTEAKTDPLTDRWNAVLARVDDAAFLYGVKSTGIYCRPACSARRPASPDKVEYFDSPDSAEAAGYRACFRCAPNQQGLWQSDLQRVQAVCRLLEANLSTPPALPAIGAMLGVSHFHLQKSFKRVLGITPRQYLDAVRVSTFKAMLREDTLVNSAARDAGIRSPGSLYGNPALNIGLPPSEYMAGSPGAMIGYTIAPCPLGFILLAATSRGVCSIKLDDQPDTLPPDLAAEFPLARINYDQTALAPMLLAALSALGEDREASVRAQHLPLDIQATAFQWRVWLALRQSKPGTVLTYSQLATDIGAPGAARAVGTACGANPVALAIPCHRVLHRDMSMSGYRWGKARKQALLDLEKDAPDSTD